MGGSEASAKLSRLLSQAIANCFAVLVVSLAANSFIIFFATRNAAIIFGVLAAEILLLIGGLVSYAIQWNLIRNLDDDG